MGLIKALTTSTSSVFGDQFKEYVSCPSMAGGVLVQRAVVNHGEGNKNPSDGIISNGSTIMVPEGTAMMVVENGKILDFSAEAGTYTFTKGTEPSIFTGNLGQSIIDSIKKIGSRTAFGGQPANDERVYYVNLLALTGNKFGSPQPKKITDDKYGMLEVTFFGEYALKVEDPAILIENIIGSNAKDTVLYSDILEDQFKSKFVEKLTQAITVVMRKHRVPFGDIGMYGTDISNEMNNLLDSDLVSKYGIKISDVAIADINLTEESMQRVSKIDDATIFANRNLQSGLMAEASAEALKNAAINEGGSMVGFMGMNMASTTGATMMDVVNQAVPQPEPKGEKVMPEPGSLFSKKEETSVVSAKEDTLSMENQVVEIPKSEDTTHEQNSVLEQSQNTKVPNFCTNCGTPTNGNGNYCGNCGHKLR